MNILCPGEAQSTTEDSQAEAETLFKQFLAEFDGQHFYRAQGIEVQFRGEAESQLAELRDRAAGMSAPEMAGVDLDDEPMKLSDYRGREVLVNFWATWCFPCMKLIPHELHLAKTMGGEGTWSLAIANPARWAAIVPICHGGDTQSAARLKDVPCWCFHGDADKVIPPQQSRLMVQAIKDSGGRPLYQEFVGVGHNDCADRVYALPDLYEWMLEQNRSKR